MNGQVMFGKKNTRFSDEILEKHPGLSDCAYMDLEKKYGGPYSKKELYKTYIEPAEFTNRNSLIDSDDSKVVFCSAPYCIDAATWLTENKNIHITTRPYYCEDGLYWMFEIRKYGDYTVSLLKTGTGYISSEAAIRQGIRYYLTEILK